MRQLDAIYCDDIRHEIGGKISLIGIYGAKLFVREFPAVLPKLCVMTKSSTPYTEPFKQLKIRVFKDAEVLAETDIKMDGGLPPLEPFMSESEGPDAPMAMIGANAFFILSPFEIEGPCTLRVRADTGEGELRGAGLRIELAPKPTT